MGALFAEVPPVRERLNVSRQKLSPVQAELARKDKELDGLQAQARKLKSAYSEISKKIGDAQQLRQLSTADGAAQIDARISTLAARQATLSSQYDALDAQARTSREEMTSLRQSILDIQTEMAPALDRQRGIEAAALELLDPFIGRPFEDAAGLQYLENRISAGDGAVPLAYFCRGCLRMRGEAVLPGLADLDRAIELDPQQVTFLAVRGFAAFLAGNEQEGRDKLLAAVSLDETNPTARYLYAGVLLKSGAVLTAEAQLREAIKSAPKDPQAFRLMALFKATSVVDSQRSAALALKNAESAQAISTPGSWKSLMALAAAKAENGQFQEAEQLASRAAESAPARRAEWCRTCTGLFREQKPLRIDWKTAAGWICL
jgi:tetratricopeptide (TPR) repeat protein